MRGLHLSSIGAASSNFLFVFAGSGLSCVSRLLQFTFSFLNTFVSIADGDVSIYIGTPSFCASI